MESSHDVTAPDRRFIQNKDFCKWSGEVEGYAWNTCRKFARQLAAQYDIDDILQEAFLVYDKARRMYSGTATSERHFMAMYKSSLYRRLLNMVRDTKLAARCGPGGCRLGDHDKEKIDHRKPDVCLDDLPEAIVRTMARVGLLDNYHGRRYAKLRGKRKGESVMGYLKRVVSGSDEDVAAVMTYLGLTKEAMPCSS